jgi:hypothetical protein
MSSTPAPNGSNRVLWWIITVLTGVSSAIGGHHLGNTSNAERLGIVEHDIATIKNDVQEIKRDLHRSLHREERR